MMTLLVRVLLGIVLLCVLAVLVLFAISRRPNAGRIVSSVEIAAPVDTVWTWITEPARLTQWVGWLAEVRRDETTPAGVGARESWFMNDPNMKKRIELKSVVTRYEPPRRVDVRVSLDQGFDGDYSYVLEPSGAGTKVTMTGTSKYVGWMIQLMEPLVTPEAAKKMNHDFGTLKRLVEGGGR